MFYYLCNAEYNISSAKHAQKITWFNVFCMKNIELQPHICEFDWCFEGEGESIYRLTQLWSCYSKGGMFIREGRRGKYWVKYRGSGCQDLVQPGGRKHVLGRQRSVLLTGPMPNILGFRQIVFENMAASKETRLFEKDLWPAQGVWLKDYLFWLIEPVHGTVGPRSLTVRPYLGPPYLSL